MSARSVCTGVLCLAVVSLVSGTALAAEITSFSVPIPASMIDPDGSVFEVPVPQFDPAGGRSLLQVDLTLTLDLSGEMGFENRDQNLSVIYTLTLAWDVSLDRPDNTTLVSITADRTRTGLVGPFDGVVDFAGSSGVTRDVAAPGESADVSTTDPADLDLFTGDGTLVLPLVAGFTGTASSVPNVQFNSHFAADLEGQLEVRYTWIPEPAGAGMLLAGLALLRRVRHNR